MAMFPGKFLTNQAQQPMSALDRLRGIMPAQQQSFERYIPGQSDPGPEEMEGGWKGYDPLAAQKAKDASAARLIPLNKLTPQGEAQGLDLNLNSNRPAFQGYDPSDPANAAIKYDALQMDPSRFSQANVLQNNYTNPQVQQDLGSLMQTYNQNRGQGYKAALASMAQPSAASAMQVANYDSPQSVSQVDATRSAPVTGEAVRRAAAASAQGVRASNAQQAFQNASQAMAQRQARTSPKQSTANTANQYAQSPQGTTNARVTNNANTQSLNRRRLGV